MSVTTPDLTAQQAEANAAAVDAAAAAPAPAADAPTAVVAPAPEPAPAPAPQPTPAPAPTPVQEVEARIEAAAPGALKPEVAAIEATFNAVEQGAAALAPEAAASAAAESPAVAAAVTDAAVIAQGGTVDLTKIVPDATRVVKEVKAGYKTTEFWVTAVVIILAQLGALHLPGKYGDTITTAAAAASYVVSRGLAK